MGLIDTGERIARHAWRIPVLGRILAMDYARSFARMPAQPVPRRLPRLRRGRAFHSAAAPRSATTTTRSPACTGTGWSKRLPERLRRPVLAARIVDARHRAVRFWWPRGRQLSMAGKLPGYPPGLRWRVCDVPAIIEVGAELARGTRRAGLRFHLGHRRRPRLQRLARRRFTAVRGPGHAATPARAWAIAAAPRAGQQDAALRRRNLRHRAVDRARVPSLSHLQPRRVRRRA